MSCSPNITPSPGSVDSLAPVMNISANIDLSSELPKSSSVITLEPYSHSSPNISGDENRKNSNLKVLYCEGLPRTIDYESLFKVMKPYGIILRMKLRLSKDKSSFETYITFNSHDQAKNALNDVQCGKVHTMNCHGKLYNVKNVNNSDYDFIPKLSDLYEADDDNDGECIKTIPEPVWYIGYYKEGCENIIKGSECLERKVGSIPRGNLKRYGRNILIKAGNESQAVLLGSFTPSPSDVIIKVTSHPIFNNSRGIVFSRDLFDFSEEEILKRCPPSVIKVKKLKGMNSAILLTFFSSHLPDYIQFRHLNISVKKFQARPMQCFRCFEFGHAITKCQNKAKCSKCSGSHNHSDECEEENFCFHCSGLHSPNSRQCPQYKIEQTIINTANDEHISFGLARRKVMGGNKKAGSSYANATTNSTVISKHNLDKTSSVPEKDPTHTTTSLHIIGQSIQSHPNTAADVAQNQVTSNLLNVLPADNLKNPSNVTFEGFWKLPSSTNHAYIQESTLKSEGISVENRYDTLLSLNEDDNDDITSSQTDDVTTDGEILSPNSKVRKKKRSLKRTPPKCKKTNTEIHPLDTNIVDKLINKSLLSGQNQLDLSQTPQSQVECVSDIDLLHKTTVVEVHNPQNNSPNNKSSSDHTHHREMNKSVPEDEKSFDETDLKEEVDSVEIDSSSVIGKSSKSINILQTTDENSKYNHSCGCNDCFTTQMMDIKQISIKTITSVIENFIRNKTKNQYGDLEKYSLDCMCMDHLVKKCANDTMDIKNLLRKFKQNKLLKVQSLRDFIPSPK